MERIERRIAQDDAARRTPAGREGREDPPSLGLSLPTLPFQQSDSQNASEPKLHPPYPTEQTQAAKNTPVWLQQPYSIPAHHKERPSTAQSAPSGDQRSREDPRQTGTQQTPSPQPVRPRTSQQVTHFSRPRAQVASAWSDSTASQQPANQSWFRAPRSTRGRDQAERLAPAPLRSTTSLASGLRQPGASTTQLGVVLPSGVFVPGVASAEDLAQSSTGSGEPLATRSATTSRAGLRSRQKDSTTLAALGATASVRHPSWQLSSMPHPNLPQHPTIHVLRHYAKLRRVDEDLGQNLTNAGVKPPMQLYPGVRYAILEQQRKVRGVGWVPAISLFILSQLNPHNVPWAFSQLGVAVATLIVAALACITGLCYFLVWKAFLEIDSIHYPAKTMQILAERVLGRPLGALVGLAQGVQLLMMASSLILSTSRLLSNIANGVRSEGAAGSIKLCFTVILAIATGVAVLSTAIRRMRRFKFVSPIVILLLLASTVVVMWSAKHTGAAESQINLQQVTFSGLINSNSSFREKVRAAMQLVFAFGGGLCLVEIMGETRRPSEFGKSLAVGQALIAVLYIIFGPVVYTVLGQFTSLPAYFGLASTGTARTMKGIILITNLGAMALFGNIGAKLLFNNLVDRLDGPLLLSTAGRYIWYALASLFWGLAFIVVAVVPQTGIVIRFVATLLILPFSVAIPASVALIFLVKRDAAQMDVFDASTLEIKASDAWEDGSRWRRGFAPQWPLKLLLAVFVVLALGVTGVGVWVAWLDLKQAFDRGTTMAIGCSAPATNFFYPIR